MDIGKKLKEKRIEANLTQQELAEILHVSRQTISSWEVGRTYPDLDVLVAISELYDTPLDDLLKEDSQMVKNITDKVKKSERRKMINIVLSLILLVFIGFKLFSTWEKVQNDQVNSYGLKPNDLIDSAWEMHFTPNQELMSSILSFESDSMMIRNQYQYFRLNPFISAEELEAFDETNPDLGLKYSTEHYENLTIETIDSTYIISGHGYQKTFEKLSDSVIRDENGTEYYKLGTSSLHDSLQYFAEREEQARNNNKE